MESKVQKSRPMHVGVFQLKKETCELTLSELSSCKKSIIFSEDKKVLNFLHENKQVQLA